jgi:hypothetical protein
LKTGRRRAAVSVCGERRPEAVLIPNNSAWIAILCGVATPAERTQMARELEGKVAVVTGGASA